MKKKKIIITAGPTNERIDAVMKITNMSTGALGATIADEFLEEEQLQKLYYLSPKLAKKPTTKNDKIILVTIESAIDLLKALKQILTTDTIDTVIHSAAVGDYYGEYAITGEQLAKEIAEIVAEEKPNEEELEKLILKIIEHPKMKTSNHHKISSYQPNLMIKLGLTPKVIHSIKKIAPNVQLIGFKLLDGVTKEELINVAEHLKETNQANYIVANDLSNIGNGKHQAYIIGNNGIEAECQTKKEIAKELRKRIF